MTQMNMMNADNDKYSKLTKHFELSFGGKILFNHNYQRHQRSIFGC
jgi:hypothetical protein